MLQTDSNDYLEIGREKIILAQIHVETNKKTKEKQIFVKKKIFEIKLAKIQKVVQFPLKNVTKGVIFTSESLLVVSCTDEVSIRHFFYFTHEKLISAFYAQENSVGIFYRSLIAFKTIILDVGHEITKIISREIKELDDYKKLPGSISFDTKKVTAFGFIQKVYFCMKPISQKEFYILCRKEMNT